MGRDLSQDGVELRHGEEVLAVLRGQVLYLKDGLVPLMAKAVPTRCRAKSSLKGVGHDPASRIDAR
jgi:hypothetical protein